MRSTSVLCGREELRGRRIFRPRDVLEAQTSATAPVLDCLDRADEESERERGENVRVAKACFRAERAAGKRAHHDEREDQSDAKDVAGRSDEVRRRDGEAQAPEKSVAWGRGRGPEPTESGRDGRKCRVISA